MARSTIFFLAFVSTILLVVSSKPAHLNRYTRGENEDSLLDISKLFLDAINDAEYNQALLEAWQSLLDNGTPENVDLLVPVLLRILDDYNTKDMDHFGKIEKFLQTSTSKRSVKLEILGAIDAAILGVTSHEERVQLAQQLTAFIKNSNKEDAARFEETLRMSLKLLSTNDKERIAQLTKLIQEKRTKKRVFQQRDNFISQLRELLAENEFQEI